MSPTIFLIAVLVVFVVAAGHYVWVSKTVGGGTELPSREVDSLERRPRPTTMFDPLLRSLAAAVFYGSILGLVIGGIGSRVAMRLLFLTSPDDVRGLESDDGFIIGRFDFGDTLGLLVLGTIIGLLGGAAYLAIRRWLPERQPVRSALCGIGGATVVGSIIVHADGVDFNLLGPLWFALGLFVLIPALFGAMIPLLVDRSDRPGSWFQRKQLPLAAAPLVVLLFPPLLIALGIPLGLTFLARRMAAQNPGALALWESGQLVWAGRIVIAAIGVLGTVALVNDVRLLT